LALGGYCAVKTPYFINPVPRPYGGNPLFFCSVLRRSRPAKTPQRVSEGYVRNDGIERPHARSMRGLRFLGKTIFRYSRYGSGVRTVPLVFYENFRRKLFLKKNYPSNLLIRNATFKAKLDCKLLKKKINDKNIKIA